MEDDSPDNLAQPGESEGEFASDSGGGSGLERGESPEQPTRGEVVNPLADAETLAELRELLVGPERRELAELRERLASSKADIHEIAAILPQAITLREQQDDQLGRALSSTVESAIQTSVKTNPQPMIDAVFPVIGPAIRKAVSDALSKAVQSLNQTLEHSLSVKSLKWRLEAARTGKSFGEVVLLNTLRYRVEQVFLIHADSGLLMHHLAADGVETRDEQLVSGMFTAIAEFVRDSFATDERAGLRTMQVGGVTVWVERGPHAVLAGAVRGSAPGELREVFEQVLEDLHLHHGELFKSFRGDDSTTAVVEPELQRCLVSAQQPGAKRKVSPALLIFTAVAAGLVGWALWAGVSSSLRWERYVDRLEQAEGVMLVEADQNWWGQSTVRGLINPSSTERPDEILAESEIDLDEVAQRWEVYPTAEPAENRPVVKAIIEPVPQVDVAAEPTRLALAESLLSPPPSVTLRVQGDVVVAQGQASAAWIASARRKADAELGGWGDGYVDERVVSLDDQRELQERLDAIESTVIAMPAGSVLDLSRQRETHRQLVTHMGKARDLADRLGKSLIVEIVGHSDTSGDAAGNQRLSEARAAAVAADLEPRFMPAITFVLRGAGTSEPKFGEDASAQDQRQNRRVTFNVELREISEPRPVQ